MEEYSGIIMFWEYFCNGTTCGANLSLEEEKFDIVSGDADLILKEMGKLSREEYICEIESIS